MVKICVDGRNVSIEFDGGPVKVAVEVGAAISGIYQGLHNVDEADADLFHHLMLRSMLDDSPVWAKEHEMTMVVIDKDVKKSDTPADQS